jgi:hypothetical protein
MYHQFSTKYIEMKKKNNTKYKTMAQSLNEEVVDTIMFQE